MPPRTRLAAGDGRLDVKMTPMIDVVFLLLVFFLWTASFQVVEQLLPSNLLATAGASVRTDVEPEQLDFERVVIRLRWLGERPVWLINDTPAADVEQVHATLRELAQVARVRSSVPVVIDPDGQVPLAHVIDVYDRARDCGFDRIQLAASEDI